MAQSRLESQINLVPDNSTLVTG